MKDEKSESLRYFDNLPAGSRAQGDRKGQEGKEEKVIKLFKKKKGVIKTPLRNQNRIFT